METRSCTRLTVPYEANYQAKQVLGAGHRPRLCVRRRAGSRACGPWSRQPGRRSSRVSERVSERANPRLREQQRVPSTGRLRTVNSSIPSANGPRSRPCVSFMVDCGRRRLAETAFYRAISYGLYRYIGRSVVLAVSRKPGGVFILGGGVGTRPALLRLGLPLRFARLYITQYQYQSSNETGRLRATESPAGPAAAGPDRSGAERRVTNGVALVAGAPRAPRRASGFKL